jgi:hypothetical protein
MYLFNMKHFFFIFWKSFCRSFSCCPPCPRTKRIYIINITPIINIQILLEGACWKASWISPPLKKIRNIYARIGIFIQGLKSLNSTYITRSPLSVTMNRDDPSLKTYTMHVIHCKKWLQILWHAHYEVPLKLVQYCVVLILQMTYFI